MSTLPNPLLASFLPGANTPALGTNIAAPAPSMGASVVPSASLAPPPPPTQTQTDMTERNRLINTGSGVDQIHNPLLRGIARAGDIAASVFTPNAARFIPGTTLHHQDLVSQATNNVAKDQAQEDTQAQIQQRQAQTAQEQASTEATTEQTAAGKRAAAKAAMSGNILYDENKNPIGYQDPTGKMMGIHDPSLPANVQDILGSVKGKTPTSEFELWHQQNPNGTAQDFNQLQSKPLSAQEAASLNSVWDGLAAKHHLPAGQFSAGMPHADATQLASALNNAIGKQQGDSHVSISLQGLQNQQTKNAPLDTGDPAMQASIDAVGKGATKLTDIFGRGATTQQKAQFVAAVKEKYPNYNSGDHDIENAVRRDFTSGTDSNSLTAINRAREHMGVFIQTAKDLDNGNVQSLNKLGNAFSTEFGSDKATNLNIAKQAFSAEVGKAFAGASVAEGDRTELQKSISTASSFGQLAGAARTADSLLAGAQKVLKQKYDQGLQGNPNFGGGNSDSGGPKEGDTKVNSHGDKVKFAGGKWGPA